ncbi:MAG TPA: hypothetical protein VKP08_08750, partial [Anaerolineales bacterium]|nr:hypothetical protein [Anaerolineales bacterium]
MKYNLAIIGFGNVGQALAQILRDQRASLAQQFDADFTIVAVCDLLKGSICDPNGLDPAVLLEAVTGTGKLETVAAPHHGWDALRTIAESGADVVVELSYTDLKTGEPALTHLRTALNAGKHVVTTNKGPIA